MTTFTFRFFVKPSSERCLNTILEYVQIFVCESVCVCVCTRARTCVCVCVCGEHSSLMSFSFALEGVPFKIAKADRLVSSFV